MSMPAAKVDAPRDAASSLGFYAAILTSVLTVVTFGIAFFTPPLSGPGCLANCYQYPFLDIAARFPRDYIWMYPAMVLTLVYFVLVAAIHHSAPAEKKVYSHIGLALALMATAVLIIDYFLQVSVIQPSLVNGETDGISILSQFNPHGIFIVLEELGYMFMSIGFLFLAPVFSGKNKVERSIRWIFILNFVLTILAFIYISFQFGIFREYIFELAVISFDWLTLIVSGILLSIVFQRAMKKSS